MSKARSFLKGWQYRLNEQAGQLAGETVVVTDPNVFPDTDEVRRRKITVEMADGSERYFLPRQLDEHPVGVDPARLGADFEMTLPTPTGPVFAPVFDTSEDDEHDVPESSVFDKATAASMALDPITDLMDPRLDHLRPFESAVRSTGPNPRYIPRMLSSGRPDFETFLEYTTDFFRSSNDGHPVNIAFKGDTQSGKTFLVEKLAVEWAKAMGLPKPMPIFTLSGSSGVTDFDLFGQTTNYTDPVTGKGRLIWLPGTVELAAQIGGILYLDELPNMNTDVTSSLHPVADHRHLFTNRNKPVWKVTKDGKGGQFMPETVKTVFDLWIIATYNEGYQGGRKLNEALHQRFDHYLWDYSPEVEAKLVKSPTVRLIGEAMRVARKEQKIRTPFSTAAMERLERNVKAFGVDFAVEIMLGMFTGNERDIAEAIVTDRSYVLMLKDEEATRTRSVTTPV